LFCWIILGFIGLAFLESTIEGDQGGAEGTKGWRKKVLGYELKEYHFWLWYIVIPIFVFSPLIALGPDFRVFGMLAIAYLVGGMLEDFLYFVINPNFGVHKWNSRYGKWMPWFKIGGVEIPQFYVRNAIAAAVVWVLFVRY
jgi:hypothetical protein